MNTPAKIARMLGWPEARSPEDVVVNLVGPMPAYRMRRIATRSRHPHLRVGKGKLYRSDREGYWWWEIALPNTTVVDRGTALSWREALAVGVAALETASMRNRT